MTITQSKFYGGYRKLEWDGTVSLSTLEKRFIRASTTNHEGVLKLPRANELPLIKGGAVFTIFNVGYHNILVKDCDGTLVGCIQGTGSSGVDACYTNVLLLNNSTTAGSWRIDCATCVDPDDTSTEDTTQTDDGGTNATTTTTEDEGDGDGYQQMP